MNMMDRIILQHVVWSIDYMEYDWLMINWQWSESDKLYSDELSLYSQGVYNLNSLMGFSRQPASQNIEPAWVENDPHLVERIEKNGNRGDFIMTMGRNIVDETQLAQTFAKHLHGQNVHHLKVSSWDPLMS